MLHCVKKIKRGDLKSGKKRVKTKSKNAQTDTNESIEHSEDVFSK